MRVLKKDIRPILFARIAPVERDMKPDRLKHRLDGLEIFCVEQGFTVMGRCGSVALQDALYQELEDLLLLVKRMKERPKPNALLIKDWNDFPDHMIDSAQLIVKCKSFGLNVFTVNHLLEKGDDVENGFDEEEGDQGNKPNAVAKKATSPKYRVGQVIDTGKDVIKILNIYPPGHEYATITMHGYWVDSSNLGKTKLIESSIDMIASGSG